jgi:hypothetical protein
MPNQNAGGDADQNLDVQCRTQFLEQCYVHLYLLQRPGIILFYVLGAII